MVNQEEIKPPVFPPDYADLEQPLRDAQQQSWEIDDQIENLPKDRGPQLAFRPPGYSDPNISANREQLISQLKDRQSVVKGNFSQVMEQRLAKSDPQTATQVRQTANYQLNNNSARQKHFDKSFMHMENMHVNKPGAEEKSNLVLPVKKQEIQPSNSKNISERSMESLQHPDKGGAVEKYGSNVKDITEPDKD